MKLMLNMIVRNEADRIERALKSVAPFITSWVIIDTGSTDGTKDKIVQFFREWGIAGEIRDLPFVNFEQARNGGLKIARMLAPIYQADYLLLMDADMELVVGDSIAFQNITDSNPIALSMAQEAGSVRYDNTRVLVSLGDFNYKGVTHEYLDVRPDASVPYDVAYFRDHADGTNRKNKFKRDIRLLLAGLKQEPNNARYMYYLASSYRDAGKHAEAAKWFKRRVNAGGWDEEVWSAQCGYATALRDLGDVDGFIGAMLKAYQMRPSRAEPMFDLSVWLREHDQPVAAFAMAEAVSHLPVSSDSLFVNKFVYDVGIKNEMAITGFYVPGKRDKAARLNDELVLSKSGFRTAARSNAYWYVRPLKELSDSFRWKKIEFVPPDGLVPLNPSVCAVWNNRVVCNVRAVNYRIDENGAYLIRGTDGTANRENPIDTRNFIVEFGRDPFATSDLTARECYRPGNLPCEFPLVTGFEDVRLWPSATGRLCGSATVRQIAADGQCEQVRFGLAETLNGTLDGFDVHVYARMLREPRVTEKNWAPILNVDCELFMCRPGHVVDSWGQDVVRHEAPVAVDHLSGSSQVIPWAGGGHLAVLHTAHALPGCDYKRFYYHRFIRYDRDFRIVGISLPWVFHDKVIEFCAGMCHNPGHTDELILSYGFKDEEARIAAISCSDVERLLAEGHSYG